MSNRFVHPRPQFMTSTPTVYSGGTLNFYITGTSTPKNVYSDAALSTSIGAELTLNSAGYYAGEIFLAIDAAYKVVLEDSSGNVVWTADPVSASGFSDSAQFLTYAGNPNGNVAGTAGSGTVQSDVIWDRTNNILYVCTTSGSAAAAVWTAVYDGSATAVLPLVPPGGRLTLTSATPVLTSDVTAATTVYYTPHVHSYAWLYNGTSWAAVAWTETSQTLSDTSKSPAATVADTNYDMFLWNDSGVIRCTRGPAWSSATARGTGAGTTELERINGAWVNKIAITSGPAAQRGLYVGTIRTNGSNQVDYMVLPAAAAGGGACKLYVWNMYNRVLVNSISRDSTDSWTYTTGVWRPANNSNSNRISLVRGLDDEAIEAEYNAFSSHSTSTVTRNCGIGLDATNSIASGSTPGGASAQGVCSHLASYTGFPGLGHHFVQALEYSVASGTMTWYGDNADAAAYQMSLRVKARM